MLSSAVKVLKIIEKNNHKAWIVGGAVRDIVMGKTPKDIDIATNAPIEKIEKIFDNTYDIGQSKSFGILLVKFGGYSYEISALRKDGKYKDGRYPESVSFDVDLPDDISRRDITFNAMAIDSDGNIIDYFKGKKDIKNKIIRTVGNPSDRFEEDYLRMLRIVRFSSRLGFDIDPETAEAIKNKKENIKKLSYERIRDEILKMATNTGDKFADAILKLDEFGMLDIILPELTKLKEFPETKEFHPESVKDDKSSVFNHVLAALKQNKLKDPLINLSLLLHDVGKGKTYKFRDGKHTFYRHAEKSKELIDNISTRLKLSNKEKNAIMFSAVNHMKMINALDMKTSKIVKLVQDENWEVLKAVSFCDDSCRKGLFDEKRFNNIINNMEKISSKWSERVLNKTIKIVDGKRVMDLTGLPGGVKIGEIINKVTGWVVDDGDSTPIDDLIMKAYKEI